MTDILIYHGKRGKRGKSYWLVDTPARLVAAKQVLFHQLDKDGCYESDVAADLLTAARAGNPEAIGRILYNRSGYEEWDIESVEVPVVLPQSATPDLAKADLPSVVPRRPIATDIGVSLTDVAAQNLAILYGRKERGTIQGDGDDR